MTREEVKAQLRALPDSGVATEVLIDWLEDAWETADLLRNIFGPDEAFRMLSAFPSLPAPISFTLLPYDLMSRRQDKSMSN